MRTSKSRMLRIVLDAKCTATDAEAIATAISLLRGVKHVEPIVDLGRDVPLGLNAPVEQLDLTTRPRNALRHAKIMTLKELTALSRFELRRVKNLGRQGLDEIEKRLTSLGLRLRPQTVGDFTASNIAARERNDKKRTEFMAEFEVIRLALRRLWMTAAQKGYVTPDWVDWKTVDVGLRAYARRASEEAAIELSYGYSGDLQPSDPDPLVLPAVSA